MAYRSEPELLVLHVLRLKGLAEPSGIARATGLDEHDVELVLKEADAAGHVARRDGRLSGWSLTEDGRAHHAERLAAELDASGCRSHVDAAYRRFLEVNGDLLAAATAWQLRDDGGTQVVNDHTDEIWDARVLDDLRDVHRRVAPVLDRLEPTLERFATYRTRLDHALAAVEAGHHDWFTKPGTESYHSTWFELHEDLLRTLGLERASEARR